MASFLEPLGLPSWSQNRNFGLDKTIPGPPLSDLNLDVSKNGVWKGSGLDFGGLGPRFWSLRASILELPGPTCRKKGFLSCLTRLCLLFESLCSFFAICPCKLEMHDSSPTFTPKMESCTCKLLKKPNHQRVMRPNWGGGGGPPRGVSMKPNWPFWPLKIVAAGPFHLLKLKVF